MEAKTILETPWTSLGAKSGQGAPKSCPRAANEGSKKGPRPAKELPRGVREGPSATFWTPLGSGGDPEILTFGTKST